MQSCRVLQQSRTPCPDLGLITSKDSLPQILCRRCMACDRPLAKLDPDMGGFIPAPPMTVSVAMDISKNNGMIPSKEAGGKSPGKKGSLVPQHSRTSIFPGPPHTGQHVAKHYMYDAVIHTSKKGFVCAQQSRTLCVPGSWDP